MDLLKQLRRKRGVQSERRIESVLKVLSERKSGDSEDNDYMILGQWQTKRLSQDDKHGIDFELLVLVGPDFTTSIKIYVQVKSSKGLAKKHLQSHPDIPVIIVDPMKTDQDLLDELDQIIKREVRNAPG